MTTKHETKTTATADQTAPLAFPGGAEALPAHMVTPFRAQIPTAVASAIRVAQS